MPLVSILLPVYNAEKYILEAIRSLLSQTLADFELLVLLDPSSDATERVVRSLSDRRIRLIANATRRGLSGSLNRGIELASGSYIARMDADDISHPRRLAVQVRFLERHPFFIGCGTWMQFYGQRKVIRHEHDPARLRARILFNTQLAHPTVMFRTKFLKQPGMQYNESANYGEDYDLWIRLIERGPITNIRRKLVSYRRHAEALSMTNAQVEQNVLEELRRRALRLVHLNATRREMTAHRCLADGTTEGTDVSHHELFAWCDRISEANVKSGFTSPDAMASVLRERLWKIDRTRGALQFFRHKALRLRQVYLSPR